MDRPAEEHRDKDKDKDKDDVRDGFRLRYGVGLNGGWFKGLSGGGPAAGLAGRLGVQINHYFGIYYQNSPVLTFTPESKYKDGSGLTVGFSDYNSVLASLTLIHIFEFAAGPSFDYVFTVNCSEVINGLASNAGCEKSSFKGFGLHGRASFIIGGLSGGGPRRDGFSINGEIHPIFLPEGTAFTAVVGLGSEWY